MDKLRIPKSSSTVDISVIDTTTWLANCTGALICDPCPPGVEKFKIPSYSILIHHPSTQERLLFDLGLRKNWRTHLSPNLLRDIAPLELEISCEKDVADILKENYVAPADVGGIIYSHHHWDHVGDTTKFSSATKIIVGPGYKGKYLPGWPLDPEAADTTSDLYEGRETLELTFEETDPKFLLISGFRSHDWFGDGSFYILDTPGHTTGHISALARTTASPSTFIFLGGDIAHHCTLFRPTEGYPLPVNVSPDPFNDPFLHGMCPTERLVALHRSRNLDDGEKKARTTPFCRVPEGPLDEDPVETQRSIDKLTTFDSDQNVFVVFAHDETLLGAIDFFPKPLNEWKAKGWGEKTHWRFLASLEKKPCIEGD